MPPPSVPPSEAIAEFRREPEEPSTKHFPADAASSRGPQVQKGNRNSIFIFVNGRLIRDRLLLHAHLLGLSQPDAAGLLIPSRCCSSSAIAKKWTSTCIRRRPKCASGISRSCTISCATRSAERLIESRPAPAFSPGGRQPRPSAARRAAAVFRIHARCWRTQAPQIRMRREPRTAGAPIRRCRSSRCGPPRAPEPRFDFGTRRSPRRRRARAAGPQAARARDARRVPARSRCRSPSRRSPRFPICARSARFTRASSSPPAATACGSSTSTWRTSASCSKRC